MQTIPLAVALEIVKRHRPGLSTYGWQRVAAKELEAWRPDPGEPASGLPLVGGRQPTIRHGSGENQGRFSIHDANALVWHLLHGEWTCQTDERDTFATIEAAGSFIHQCAAQPAAEASRLPLDELRALRLAVTSGSLQNSRSDSIRQWVDLIIGKMQASTDAMDDGWEPQPTGAAVAAKDSLTKDDPPGWYECVHVQAKGNDPRITEWWDGENIRHRPGSCGKWPMSEFYEFRGPLTAGSEAAELRAEVALLKMCLEDSGKLCEMEADKLTAATQRAEKAEAALPVVIKGDGKPLPVGVWVEECEVGFQAYQVFSDSDLVFTADEDCRYIRVDPLFVSTAAEVEKGGGE